MTVSISSSQIKEVEWKDQVLLVRFNDKKNSVWSYQEVPENVFKELTTAESAGKYFHQNIKKNYNAIKIQ